MKADLRSWRTILFVPLLSLGCQFLENLDPGDGTTGSDPKTTPNAPVLAAEADRGPAFSPGLDTALRHGVTPPPAGGSTYHVDPFVFAMLVEQGRDGGLPVEPGTLADGRSTVDVGEVEPNRLLSVLGVKKGDRILSINEQPVGDLPSLVPALAAGGSRVVVELLRDDYALTLEYRLVGGMAWSRALAAYGKVPTTPAPIEAPAVEVPPDDPPQGPEGPEVPKAPSPRPTPSTVPTSQPRPPRSPAPADVRCTSSSSCEIKKTRFDALVNDPRELERQANIVPAIRNDVQSGYKLKTVRPGSDLHALGFRSGDKVTRINGHDLGDDAQAMQLYFKVSATRVFDIRYERGGRTLRKVVRVK